MTTTRVQYNEDGSIKKVSISENGYHASGSTSKEAQKNLETLKNEAKQSYSSVSYTDSERGRKTKRTSYSGGKGSTPVSQTTTIQLKTIEGEQPKVIDLAPDPMRNNKNQTSVQFADQTTRFVKNIQGSGYYDRQLQQSISEQEALKRMQSKFSIKKEENTNRLKVIVKDELKKERSTFKEAYQQFKDQGGLKQELKNFGSVSKELFQTLDLGFKNFFAGTQTILGNPKEFIKSLKQGKLTQEFQQARVKNVANLVYSQKRFKNTEQLDAQVRRIVSDQGTQDLKTFGATYGTFMGTLGLSTFGSVGVAVAGIGDFGLALPEFTRVLTDPANPRKRALAYLELADIGIDFVPNVAGKVRNNLFPETAFNVDVKTYLDSDTKFKQDLITSRLTAKQYIDLSQNLPNTKFQEFIKEIQIVEKPRGFAETTNTNYAGFPDYSQSIFVNEQIETLKFPKNQQQLIYGVLTESGIKPFRQLNPNLKIRGKKGELSTSFNNALTGYVVGNLNYQTQLYGFNTLSNINSNSNLIVNYNPIKELEKQQTIDLYKVDGNFQINPNVRTRTGFNTLSRSRIEAITKEANLINSRPRSRSGGRANTKANSIIDTQFNALINANTDINTNVNTLVNTQINTQYNANQNFNFNFNLNQNFNQNFNLNIPSFQDKRPKRQQFEQGFDVFVKSRGQFKKVGVNLSRFDALKLGYDTIDKTASASFKVASSGRQTSKRQSGFDSFFNSVFNQRVRRSKKDSNVFVERRKFRISTGGEKEQITFKASRNKFLRGLF